MNCGIGDAAQNDKGLEAAMKDIALITGQKPVKTRARASIATFKIREDQPLGIAVTLRGDVRSFALALLQSNFPIELFTYWRFVILTVVTDNVLVLGSSYQLSPSKNSRFPRCESQ